MKGFLTGRPMSTKKVPARTVPIDTIAIIMLCFLRHLLAVRLPIAPRGYMTDDYLMLQMAGGLLSGSWLGAYGHATLMKGMFYPAFLAAAHSAGISYLSALDLVNMAACLFFVHAVRSLLPDRRLRFLLTAVLLFEPCMLSELTFQRVYRCSVMEMQVLFLFGSAFGRYLTAGRPAGTGPLRARPADLLYALINGAALWSMWNSREESAWIVPFIGTAMVLTGARLIMAFRKGTIPGRCFLFRFSALFLPCFLLFAGNNAVRAMNARYYGESVRLEECDGTYKDALQSIFSVKSKVNLPYTTVPREKLERLYAVSPSLESIRQELDGQMAYYDMVDRHPGDGETEDGWFYWGLKKAAYIAGAADTLPKSQAYWAQVAAEIEEALADPGTGMERQPVMPSALAYPWRAEYKKVLPGCFLDSVRYTVSYKEVRVLTEPSGKASQSVSNAFESVTGNRALYQEAWLEHVNRPVRARMEPAERILTWITGLYRTVNPVVFGLAVLLYLRILAGTAVRVLQGKHAGNETESTRDNVPFLLITAGMALSAFVILMGVCYTEITAFRALRYDYLAGVYPLMIAGEWLTILYTIQGIKCRRTLS